MNPAYVIVSLLFFTSATMTIAMGIAWFHFGRQRHILSWMLSYVAAMAQWMANAGGIAVSSSGLMALAACLIVASATLLLVGVRQRSGQPIPWRLILCAGSIFALGGIYAAMIGNRPLQGMITPAYAGMMMLWSAVSLRRHRRKLTSPEAAFFAIMILFMTFQLALVTSAGINVVINSALGLGPYRAIMALCLPSIYVATGVAAVLVVAGDLAEQLGREMRHDPLTNVLNRRGLNEAAAGAIANARRHSRPLTFVICDMDGFKALNDGYGHITGDAALQGFAQLLTSAVRRSDIVGRMGGDEFGLLLTDTNAIAAADVMERVRMEIGCLTLPDAPTAQLRASFGVAELSDSDEYLDDIVAKADSALYEAKNLGRDKVAVWKQPS